MSTLLDAPIPATFSGKPVRVFGITPDGRILIAHADGHTETTNWESLRLQAAPAPVPTRSPFWVRNPSEEMEMAFDAVDEDDAWAQWCSYWGARWRVAPDAMDLDRGAHTISRVTANDLARLQEGEE